jgi:tetratricopeptide (TPR) repeat protein
MQGSKLGNRQDISEDKSRPFRYAAFISYAHADETAAARLHNMLEAYRPPRPHQGKGDLLRPIFRDKAELTASHSLSDEIKAAVEGSRKLLVLCSPAAKVSHWVNEEIKLFRSLHGEDAILCALVEGTPETSFPPALLDDGREPLAADLSGGKEGFRYGVLQIAASLLGIGLDDLVRRDLRRRRRIGTSVVAGALIFSGAMGASTLSAMKARAAADANRAEAENLVEYMITDLKTKLEPVGRLDILDGVGDKVMEYYAGQSLADMPDERIARQARAQHLLGQVALDAGRYDDAKTQIDAAYALTKEVLKRNPDDTDAIFAHAQSAFWVGEVFEEQGKINQTVPYWQEYRDLAHVLYIKDKTNFDFVMEAAWGENNLGILARSQKRYLAAEEKYEKALELFVEALKLNPNSNEAKREYADSLIGAEQVYLSQRDIFSALKTRKESLSISEKLLRGSPSNLNFQYDYALKQSNMLRQYHPILDIYTKQKLSVEPVKVFKSLYEHDPSNVWWSRRYIGHLILLEKLQSEETALQSELNDLTQLVEFAPEGMITESIHLLYLQIVAKREISIGQYSFGLETVKKIERIIEDNSENSALAEFVLATLYAELGNQTKAVSYAEAFLKNNLGNSPDALLNIAHSYRILKECEKAIKTIEPIISNSPKSTPEIEHIKNCET